MAASLKEVKEWMEDNPAEAKALLALNNVANVAVSEFGAAQNNIQANILSFKTRAITIEGVTVNIITLD